MANLMPQRFPNGVRQGVYVTRDRSGNPIPTGVTSPLGTSEGVRIRLFLFSVGGYNAAVGRIGFRPRTEEQKRSVAHLENVCLVLLVESSRLTGKQTVRLLFAKAEARMRAGGLVASPPRRDVI